MSEAIQAGGLQRRKRLFEMTPGRRKMVVEVIAALFILLFLYTAINKSFKIQPTVEVLKLLPLTNTIPEVIAWTIVTAEYLVSALLFFQKTKKTGLYCSLSLMVAFTLYIGYMMIFAPSLPCTCGGIISKLNWKEHLLLNGSLIFLLITSVLLMRSKPTSKN